MAFIWMEILESLLSEITLLWVDFKAMWAFCGYYLWLDTDMARLVVRLDAKKTHNTIGFADLLEKKNVDTHSKLNS